MSTWPQWEYQLHTGSYGGVDGRFKRRKRKVPVGFAPSVPPKPRPKPKGKR